MNGAGPVIEVRGVTAGYGRGAVIHDVSLSVERGETIALFGGSGSGKTTLIRVIEGMVVPSDGDVRVLGHPPRDVGRQMGTAPDSPRPVGHLTPNRALSAALIRVGVPPSQRPARSAEALEAVDLYAARDRPGRELSGGQRAAMAIACAIAHRPAVLLLDSVTAALSEEARESLWERLRERSQSDGLTIVHATPIEAEAERADRVLLMDGGRGLACGTPRNLMYELAPDTVEIEALDPALVRRTLRGVFDVEIEEIPGGVRFQPADGLSAAAQLLRHPTESVRAIYVRRPTLRDAIERLRR